MSMSIKELIEKVKVKDQSAFNSLLSQFEPLIKSLLSSYRESLAPEDIEEMYGEAVVALFSAAHSYDAEMDGVEFGLYAKICIKNRLVTAYRKYQRRSRIKVVPFSAEDGDTDDVCEHFTYDDPSHEIIERENFEALRKKISDTLSDYENRVWWLYMSGLSAKQIASSLVAQFDDCTEKSVSNALYRIRKKLRAALSEH
jgi:RNA polymerase sigma factor (sigma-70 family)